MRIGCQTITFGDDQRDRFEWVFSSVREAGYDGVEIGYRRIAGYDFGRLKELLAASSLELFASHIGGNLDDSSQAAEERALVDTILDDLDKLDVGTLMYSGLSFESAEQFERDLAAVDRYARMAADRGIRLLYHNHNWEILDDARVLRALLDCTGEHLGFCPDVGWIFKGGLPVCDVLGMLEGRIGAVHFKDFASKSAGEAPEDLDTVEFGRGAAPLRDAAGWVSEHAPGVWVVAEQDVSSLPPAEAVKRNATYLESLFGRSG